MRTIIILAAIATALCGYAAEKPAVERLHATAVFMTEQIRTNMVATPYSLAQVLTPKEVERLRADIIGNRDFVHTLHIVRFDGREFLALDLHMGYGVAYKHVGIYAPEDDGTFHLCLFAKSWAAGALDATLDQKAGILQLSERANSKLKGEVVLTCNLKTIGTQSSTGTK